MVDYSSELDFEFPIPTSTGSFFTTPKGVLILIRCRVIVPTLPTSIHSSCLINTSLGLVILGSIGLSPVLCVNIEQNYLKKGNRVGRPGLIVSLTRRGIKVLSLFHNHELYLFSSNFRFPYYRKYLFEDPGVTFSLE